MHIKDIKNNLKVLKKRASGSVETAIKVLTAVVLGAAILMGLYGLVTGVVLPSTETAVSSMFAYSAEANGGSGTETPTPTPGEPTEVTFTVEQYFIEGGADDPTLGYLTATHTVTVPAGTTWREWIETGDKGNLSIELQSEEGYYFNILVGICTCYSEIPNNLDTPIVAGTYRVGCC